MSANRANIWPARQVGRSGAGAAGATECVLASKTSCCHHEKFSSCLKTAEVLEIARALQAFFLIPPAKPQPLFSYFPTIRLSDRTPRDVSLTSLSVLLFPHRCQRPSNSRMPPDMPASHPKCRSTRHCRSSIGRKSTGRKTSWVELERWQSSRALIVYDWCISQPLLRGVRLANSQRYKVMLSRLSKHSCASHKTVPQSTRAYPSIPILDTLCIYSFQTSRLWTSPLRGS